MVSQRLTLSYYLNKDIIYIRAYALVGYMSVCMFANAYWFVFACSPVVYRLVPAWMPNEQYHLVLTKGIDNNKAEYNILAYHIHSISH